MSSERRAVPERREGGQVVDQGSSIPKVRFLKRRGGLGAQRRLGRRARQSAPELAAEVGTELAAIFRVGARCPLAAQPAFSIWSRYRSESPRMG